jgi:hypothetical protein
MDFQEMAKDEFNTEEETRTLLQLDNFERQAHTGALFEDLQRHPAWRKVEEYIDNFIKESNNKIFSDPDGDHRKAIFQVQGVIMLRNWINAQRLAGHIAAKGIADHFKAISDEKKALGLE